MILAGLALLAVGVADLIRQFQSSHRRWILMAAGALLLFLAAVAVDAAVWSIPALAIAALWVLTVPSDGSARAGLWPVGVLAVVATVAVLLVGPRASTIGFDPLWSLPGPTASVPADVLVLVVGAIAFLLESANIVVRTALRAEDVPSTTEGEPDAAAARRPGLKGGRLIGPLERVLVFALMLVGAYTLIAAVLAAKGIVRFPEISRDSDAGNRAEYFLVGSLVSWVLALAAAFLVWWGAR